MVILPGIAALGASRAFSQTQTAGSSGGTGTVSHKAIARYSSLKSFYTIPKSAVKQAKYVGFLTTLLSLTPGQEAEAARIFATASASHAEVKISLKTARQTLGQAVKDNDGGAISRASGVIGRLASELHSLGANAQAAFYQLLTGDQQAKFNQFRG
jgi:hypothetical protein